MKTGLSKAFCSMEFCHLNLHGRYIITQSTQSFTVSVTGQFQALCMYQHKNEEEEEEEKKKREKRRIWINVKMKI
jgi:hypothetical protein